MKAQYLEEANKRRSEWAAGDAKRDEGLTDPADVRADVNIVYAPSESPEEEQWHLADIYYPVPTTAEYDKGDKFYTIVSVHGGGWFYGDKELYSHYCRKLASYGFAVVNFNYRLSPEYQYPAGFMDVCRLFDYISRESDKLHLDMNHLFGVGDSAGAQLLSQYSIWATNKEYHALLDPEFALEAPVPGRIGLNCGVYDMRSMLGRESLYDWYLEDELLKDVEGNTNPGKSFFGIMNYITKDFPETYLMLSVNDALKIHTIPMKEKLEELGVHMIFREWGEDCEEDGHVFHVNMRSENGIRCNEEEIAFFRAWDKERG